MNCFTSFLMIRIKKEAAILHSCWLQWWMKREAEAEPWLWAGEQTCPRVFAALGPSAVEEEISSFDSSKAGFSFSIL